MKTKYILLFMGVVISLTACKKAYFDSKGSLDGTTIANYFNTAEEVRAFTSTLYSGLPWAGYEERASTCIADVMSGNTYTSSSEDAAFLNFTIASTSSYLSASWNALYKVAGWATADRNALELKKSMGGNASFIDPGIAECDFMIGTAYFFLARAWGAVPIIENPGTVALEGTSGVTPRYLQADVLKFAANKFKSAIAVLPETDVAGRLTKNSAKGMLAKLYLYRATALGSVADYDSAKLYAGDVISSGKYSLVTDYAAMFNSSTYNNNSESLFSIQHQATQNPWGSGNQKQPDYGPDNLATDQANMWGLYIPSLDLLKAFETGDLRRAGSVMEQGWTHSSWKPQKSGAIAYNAFMASGYKYDTIQPTDQGGQKNPTRSNIAKYVVGPGASYGSEAVVGMNTGQHFMVLRYADILLIYAEAVLAKGTSTTDAAAIAAFNKVRTRAGLATKSSITLADIMQERRVELAFEGDYWFDLQRQGFTKAKAIISAQNRGSVDISNYVTTFTQAKMYLPIPAGEIVTDPELAKDPVAYYK